MCDSNSIKNILITFVYHTDIAKYINSFVCAVLQKHMHSFICCK